MEAIMFTASSLLVGKVIIMLVLAGIGGTITFTLVLGAYLTLNKMGYYPRYLTNISPAMKREISVELAKDRMRRWISPDVSSRLPRDEGYYYTYLHGGNVAFAIGAFVAALVFVYGLYAL